ncbi:MAG: glutamate synthase-related protein [Alphaproteobacteria bacterium]|nr:glutamate synthase-related protein [Alphaproteobacteria bacterium]MDP6621843.1 glutamate synthase-related protein [Alphaproteobacteria bacterium]
MATLDLARTTVRQANEQIRAYGAAGEDVEILNPDARHHIGVGLVHGIAVRIRGSAGYFCAGLTDGAHFQIDNNAGWGLADNMLAGSVVVGGNASAIAGVAIRGAEVVVRGNLGSRAGQVMKAGTLCCGGNANFMAGYMMYGGRIIILGDAGQQVGQDMTGGSIYVGGNIDSLGGDAALIDLPAIEHDSIREFLDQYEVTYRGTFQKIENAGQRLRYSRSEPRIRNAPFFLASGDSDYWNETVQQDIHIKAEIGRYRIRGYGTTRAVPHLSDLAFRHDLMAEPTAADVVDKVDMHTAIGGRHGGRPLDLSMPVMIAPMSYGALSKSAKLALATASRLAGISENTGEGGMMDAQRAEADQLIYQCLSGRLGWSVHDMQRADGIEIYVSQGAKPGLGGQLMAKKVTAEIARIRGIPEGIDLRSPSRHPDVLGADDLVIKVEEFREATGYRVPISIKLGAGRVRDDIKIAYKDGFDFVELDGLQGSTGAAGNEVLEFVGIPTLSAIQEAVDALDEVGGGDLALVLMGGIKDGVDAAKAIALGARAVALGTSALIAGGCIACLQCHVGNCVVGIATQDVEHESRYDVPREAANIYRFLESVRWQLAAITHGLGHRHVSRLSRDDLVALTPEAAAITRLPYDPGYRQAAHSILPRAP